MNPIKPIIVDTGIIINFLRGSDNYLSLFLKERIIISGVSLAELLHGCRGKKEQKLIEDLYHQYHNQAVEKINWANVGNNLASLRKNGLTVPFQDVVLATQTMDNNLSIASDDKHFGAISKILNLSLYRF